MKKNIAFEIINYLAFILAISFGIYLANGQVLFGDNPEEVLSLTSTLIYFGVALAGFIPLLVINLIRKKYRPNYVILGLFTLLIITLVISLLTFPDHVIYSYNGIKNNPCSFIFYISTELRATFIIQAVAFALTGFILIDFPYQLFRLKPFLTILSSLTIIAVLTFQILSFIKEGSQYIEFFSISLFKIKENFAIKSVFVNSNIFAFILTLGLIAVIFMHYLYKKWWILLFTLPIYINIIFTVCRSLIILNFVLLLIYLATAIARKLAHNRRIKTICMLAVIFILFMVFGGLKIALINSTNHSDFVAFLFDNGSLGFLATRNYMWKISSICINYGNWGLGVGYNLFGEILFRMNASDLESKYVAVRGSHNFALEYIGNGGIITLLIVLAILFMIIYLAIKSFKKNKTLMALSLTLITLFSTYSLIESGSFIIPKSYEFVALNLFIISPILMTYKNKEAN